MLAYTAPVLGVLLFFGVAGLLVVVVVTGLVATEIVRPRRLTESWAIARGLPSDPGECGLPFSSWEATIGERRTLPVWDVMGQGGGSGPTIVLVHDHGESRIPLLPDLPAWASVAKRVILYDRPGHGWAAGIARCGAGEGDHLRRLLEHVEADRVVLIALGEGGGIATEAIADALVRRRITAAVLVGEHPTQRTVVQERLAAHGLPRWLFRPLVMLTLRALGVGEAGEAGGAGERGRTSNDPVPILRLPASRDDKTDSPLGPGVAGRVSEFLRRVCGLSPDEEPCAAG